MFDLVIDRIADLWNHLDMFTLVLLKTMLVTHVARAGSQDVADTLQCCSANHDGELVTAVRGIVTLWNVMQADGRSDESPKLQPARCVRDQPVVVDLEAHTSREADCLHVRADKSKLVDLLHKRSTLHAKDAPTLGFSTPVLPGVRNGGRMVMSFFMEW